MDVITVLEKVREIIGQCDDRKDKIMCEYCPMKKYCEHLEKKVLDKSYTN